jgi:Ser/Thr protein kinase RdoA (MazF antagonist)
VRSSKSPFDAACAEQVSVDRFGIVARATPLPGYGDSNFRLDDAAGPVGTLKLALESPSRAHLETQDAALAHLSALGHPVPRARPGLDGRTLQDVHVPGLGVRSARLITWVAGRPLGAEAHVSLGLEHEVGVLLARVATGLASFHAPPPSRVWAWDLAHAGLAREALRAVGEAAMQRMLAAQLDHFERELRGELARLPRAWIHGDGNAWNVLVSGTAPHVQVAGLIDFGDLAWSARVGDAAVAIAYALLRHEDASGARALLAGYESVLPLARAERALLPHLAPLRLAVSVAMSAAAREQAPDNAYLSADAAPAAEWLRRQGGAPLADLLD